MIYFDRSASEYFDISYRGNGEFHIAKDAYKRVMGDKLDQEHLDLLSSQKTTLALTRASEDAPGWWHIEYSYK